MGQLVTSVFSCRVGDTTAEIKKHNHHEPIGCYFGPVCQRHCCPYRNSLACRHRSPPPCRSLGLCPCCRPCHNCRFRWTCPRRNCPWWTISCPNCPCCPH